MSINVPIPPVPETDPEDKTDDDPVHPVWKIVSEAIAKIDSSTADAVQKIVDKSINYAKNEKTQSNAKAIGMVLASSVNITSIIMLVILAVRGVI